MSKNRLKVGLNGSPGSKLTDVSNKFRKFGIDVFDADLQIKWLINYDKQVFGLIKKNFGISYTISDYINPLAFDNDQKFDKLLDLIEYPLFNSWKEFCERNSDKIYCIFSSSLIFERNWEKRFDFLANVYRPKTERIEEFKEVHNLNLSYCYNIFENELDELEKNKKSDLIIHDYLGNQTLSDQILKCDNTIVDLYFQIREKEGVV